MKDSWSPNAQHYCTRSLPEAWVNFEHHTEGSFGWTARVLGLWALPSLTIHYFIIFISQSILPINLDQNFYLRLRAKGKPSLVATSWNSESRATWNRPNHTGHVSVHVSMDVRTNEPRARRPNTQHEHDNTADSFVHFLLLILQVCKHIISVSL